MRTIADRGGGGVLPSRTSARLPKGENVFFREFYHVFIFLSENYLPFMCNVIWLGIMFHMNGLFH